MNGEHMVAGSEENKRQDFTVNSIQGQGLTMTEFEHGTWFLGILEVMWGWWKWVLESGMSWKLISTSLWVLWDVTQVQYTGPQAKEYCGSRRMNRHCGCTCSMHEVMCFHAPGRVEAQLKSKLHMGLKRWIM